MDEKEIMLGLWKAFDLVDHDILLRKMGRMGIRGVTLNWFQTYLESREQEVAITSRCKETSNTIDCLSQRRNISHGIPQRSVLGPVLFLLYKNGLETSLELEIPPFFAGDTSISITGNSANDIQRKMNEPINKLTEWFQGNQIYK
jgi:hypothetical protein